MSLKLNKNIFSKFDEVLFLGIIPIILASFATLWPIANSGQFFGRQVLYVLIGIVAYFFFAHIDPRFFRKTKFIVILYAISLFLLTLLLFVAKATNGSKSWFDLGLFAFQPVDLIKIVLVIILAKYFSKRHVAIADSRHIVVSFLYTIIPFGLVLLQPDFGSAMILLSIWFGLVLISGLSRKQILVLVSIGAIILGLMYLFVFKDYQKKRIQNFINPLSDIHGSGYNVLQSTIAVGSGQLIGKGFGFGTQSRLKFLPEHETDFIFASFAEEWGFVGVLLLMVSYLIIILRILYNAKYMQSNFEILFCVGLAILFLSHIVINVGMNIGIMPVTGITLPFMSYGGSHILASFVGLGIMQAMKSYSREYHREDIRNEFLGLEK
jgi:rod shape determining protein RodA